MECKLWLCRIFDLVMTMRLDIRLSLLLNQYRIEFESGKWSGANLPDQSSDRMTAITAQS
eukprot:2437135-Prymnesium_polylepis.1